jgi:branched-chain amino acid transport system permease protein
MTTLPSNTALALDWITASRAQPWQPPRGAAPWGWAALALLMAGVVPLSGSDYLFSAVLIPWLVLSLAGLGQNLLTGYAGQLSVGSAAFMCVGAFASYNLLLRVPGLPLLLALAGGGLITAAFGAVVGLPSLRIRGFYLIVATLAAQFFAPWVFTQFGWFSNFSASGVISAPRLVVAGVDLSHPAGRYLLTLVVTALLTLAAWALVRGPLGRQWQAVRDMETAAAVMGLPVAWAKLSAFAVSSFVLGVAGALWAFAYVGTVEPHGFDLARSFQVLFIVILGGLGSIVGSFIGAAFMVLLPIALSNLAGAGLAGGIDAGNLPNAEKIVVGTLIIVFLIREPDGLWKLARGWFERCRRWPLRH